MSPTKGLERFTILDPPHRETVFGDYEEQYSAKTVDPDVAITASIRHHHPDMTLAATPNSNANLLSFAAAGYAHAELDTAEDSVLRWRLYQPAAVRGNPGGLADATFFARYRYEWNNLTFILYTAIEGISVINYILFPPDVRSPRNWPSVPRLSHFFLSIFRRSPQKVPIDTQLSLLSLLVARSYHRPFEYPLLQNAHPFTTMTLEDVAH